MTPDRLIDSLGRSWQMGPSLGRGTWGSSRLVRDASGREAVLKAPHRRQDFPAEAQVPEELVRACPRIAKEQAEFLQEATNQASESPVQPPRLEATADLGEGRLGLILPRYTSLHQRIGQGWPVAEALRLVHSVAAGLAQSHRAHGNLKPANLLLGERGEVYLADPCTPTLALHVAELARHSGASAWQPRGSRSGGPGSDTWALCQVLWATLMDAAPSPGGVDKLEVASAKDKAHARFGAEGSNPRFRGRVAERLGALLARGLSREAEPSPPYRFGSARELAERVAEVQALIRPRVVDVGRLLPPAHAADTVFVGEDPVRFSVTVGCSSGVSDPEDLVCGLQLVDLDAVGEGRIPIGDAGVDVQVHPSGRLRYGLQLSTVRPGRYRLRVAFAVKDSGDEPQVATAELQVRPAPGYVPPAAEVAGPSAIPFPRARSAPPPELGDRPSDPASDRGSDPGEPVGRAQPTPPRAGTVTPLAQAIRRDAERASSQGRSTGDEGPPRERATLVPLRAVPPPSDESDPDEEDRTEPEPEAAWAPASEEEAPSSLRDDTEEEDRTFPRPIAPPEEPEPEPEPAPTPPVARPRLQVAPVVPGGTTAVSAAQAHPGLPPRSLPHPAVPAQIVTRLEEAEGLDTDELLIDVDEEMEISAPRPQRTPLPQPVPAAPLPPRPEAAGPSTAGPSTAAWTAEPRPEEDLPGFDPFDPGPRKPNLPPGLVAVLEILVRDRYLSVGVAVAASLFLVLTLTLLVKSC